MVVLWLVLSFCSLILAKEECGGGFGGQTRIVGGYDVGYLKYSWFAVLLRLESVACGASLIAPKTVLTAAHCYKDFLDLAHKGRVKLEDMYSVKLGVYNICMAEANQRKYSVEKVLVHELYGSKQPYYDIALVLLKEDTTGFQPICLPPQPFNKRPKEGVVPGLGTLHYEGNLPCTLHEARLLVYSNSDCASMMNSTGNSPEDMVNAFCAGYLQGGVDTCQGDSGGPLQVLNREGKYEILGLVSFGFHCAKPGLLGIYTDVSLYLDWLRNKSEAVRDILSPTTKKPEVLTSSLAPTTQKSNKPIYVPYWRPLHLYIWRKKNTSTKTKQVKLYHKKHA